MAFLIGYHPEAVGIRKSLTHITDAASKKKAFKRVNNYFYYTRLENTSVDINDNLFTVASKTKAIECLHKSAPVRKPLLITLRDCRLVT